jgi:hypothetical protein
VVEHLNRDQVDGQAAFEVVGLAAGRKVEQLVEQARRFKAGAVAIADPGQAFRLERALPGTRVFAGEEAAREMVEALEASDVVAAVVGSAGLPATMVAARKGMTISLANKETLVAAGALVTPLIRRHNARLIPVDSEHSAIFQCLQSHAATSFGRAIPHHALRDHAGCHRGAGVAASDLDDGAQNHDRLGDDDEQGLGNRRSPLAFRPAGKKDRGHYSSAIHGS